jgi:S-adenosylmethionine decarboxylase
VPQKGVLFYFLTVLVACAGGKKSLSLPTRLSILKHTQTDPDHLPNESLVARAIPGLHIIANLSVPAPAHKLIEFEDFRAFIDGEITKLGLTRVGEVYHNFPGGGFTGVVCLTESHLSVHTWPEQAYLTFDVYLSNHLKDNRAITHALYKAVKAYFHGTPQLEQYIDR